MLRRRTIASSPLTAAALRAPVQGDLHVGQSVRLDLATGDPRGGQRKALATMAAMATLAASVTSTERRASCRLRRRRRAQRDTSNCWQRNHLRFVSPKIAPRDT